LEKKEQAVEVQGDVKGLAKIRGRTEREAGGQDNGQETPQPTIDQT
jgi:hypothetical protein